MKKYTVIDINSNQHVVYADDVSNVSEGDHVTIKFWRLINGENKCCSFFNFDNVICVTEGKIDSVEILESEVEADNPVETKIDGNRVGCYSCKFENQKITDEPCMDCWYNNKWEAKNDKTTL